MEATIKIKIGGKEIRVDRRVYELLFENSISYDYKAYKDSLVKNQIPFKEFVEKCRKGGIPYSIFFAKERFVQDCITLKLTKVYQGVSKKNISMNSRGNINLRDVDLIIRDLTRKQELLKKHNKYNNSDILGLLRRSQDSTEKQADILREKLGIDLQKIKKLNKTKTFNYLVTLIEGQNVFVSQSSRTFMPQIIRNDVRFSGLCVRDKKVPFIFLNNKENTKIFEPEGRKVLTITLLLVCLTKGKFRAVKYNEQSKNLITNSEYLIAEEVLMPKKEIKKLEIDTLDDIKKNSDEYSVSPSAFIMRLYRLGIINKKSAFEYLDELKEEFNLLKEGRAGRPKPENGFVKYNGVAYSREIYKLMDNGQLFPRDVVRLLFKNEMSTGFIEDYRNIL